LFFTLVFDSDCGPCTRFKNVISFLDTGGSVAYVGLSEADMMGKLDSVPVGLRHGSFHLISLNGEVKSGPAAFPDLARLLPGGSLLARHLERSVPASRLAEVLYGVLSRLHNGGACLRIGPGTESTSISTSMDAKEYAATGLQGSLAFVQPILGQ
jgi:predicted DCC family thiol-disulfide oxidoreductase YuxK